MEVSQPPALYFAVREWLTADDAVECGLALRAVEPDALLTETMGLAERIARMPVSSLVETKRLVLAGRIDAIRAARAREDGAFAHMVGRPHNLEGADGVPGESKNPTSERSLSADVASSA